MILIFKIKKSIYHQKLGQSLRMAENLTVKPCRQLSDVMEFNSEIILLLLTSSHF